jgi:hypothetical protein
MASNQHIFSADENASYTLNYDGSNNLTSVVKVVNGTTYTVTLAYTGTRLDTVSVWVKS